MGLQASGKTTFAAALWHLLDSRETKTRLTKGAHVGDFRYLDEIAQAWCEGWQVSRTKVEQFEPVSVYLREPSSGVDVQLQFADLSGESFEKAFATRSCRPAFVDLIKSASGIILFLSADRKIDGVTILDAIDPAERPDEVDEDSSGEAPFVAGNTPHQVQLVDLLQAMRLPPINKSFLKLAVVVSAWDLSTEVAPEAWVQKRYPLLYQFLTTSIGKAFVRFYGVSAQGASLPTKGDASTAERDRLLTLVPASQRIRIVGDEALDHDLTAPIHWLSGLK
jgi:hypothetical protein